MKIIKEHAISLCPICYEKINASVVEEESKVFMLKECSTHGKFRGLVENDVDFYRKITSRPKDDTGFMRCLMINVTHACNLKCHLCYLPERDTKKDLSLKEIKEAIKNYTGMAISLSGGEPTLREDLPEIIEYISKKGKIPILVTNGVKLVDISYLKILKEAGLLIINFSCNGFTEKVFLAIENAPLLNIKMKALSNIKSLGIKTQFSFTMSQGINDDQFGRAIKYILENEDFIYQLRARVSTPIGISLGEKSIYLSDFLEVLAKEINVPKSAILEYWLTYSPFPNPYVFTMNYHHFLAGYHKKELIRRPGGDLVIFSWPDRYNIDYNEIRSLDLDILSNKKEVLNYWDGIIRNEKYNFL